jgi:tetratricopeptide (TPR) repeat protein
VDYSESIRLNPIARYYGTRAEIYYKKKDYTRAITDFNEAIRLESKILGIQSYSYWQGRGLAFQAVGDRARARADFVRSEELSAKAKAFFGLKSPWDTVSVKDSGPPHRLGGCWAVHFLSRVNLVQGPSPGSLSMLLNST